MAVVWLARDLKHERPVAIKILRPELGAVIGPDRFRREIRVTAALQHPHILPLHDSGECAGLLYYVMPYVTGETLRARLAREGPLSLDEALRLAAEVGGALGHAHRHGVVHRDVKPENVLLADGQALVADFGIARGAESERLTETGMSLGTPAYMSPEQGAGDGVDARSDQYALAAMTYEMLAGEPPFTAPTAQAVIAKQVAQPAPSIRTTRPAIPPHVDAALQRALAKQPADRFASVTDFVDALQHAPATAVRPRTTIMTGTARRRLLAAAIAAVLLLGAVALARRLGNPRAATTLDKDAVAVLPFRTDGADPSLAYIGEGMVDLVAVKLPGGGGLRATAPRATLAAWRSEAQRRADDPARAVAVRLGAGLLLDGSLVGSPSHLTLNATLRDAAAGGVVGTGEVSGPADSLPALVDRLVIVLLAGRSRVTPQQLSGMTSLPALREYLAGLASHRAARYDEALQHFDAALREDSSFALAAVAAIPSAWRASDAQRVEAVSARALRFAPQLHGGDSLVLRAYAGDGVHDRSMVELIQDWETAVAAVPDRAEAWFELGDRQLHDGLLNDYPDALARAKRSLERSLALDSSFAITADHLLLLAMHQDDSAAAARLAPLVRRVGAQGEWAGSFTWIMAVLSHDTAAVRRVRERFPTFTAGSLLRIQGVAQLDNGTIEDAELALAEMGRRASTAAQSRSVLNRQRAVALNGGHPALGEELSRRIAAAGAPAPYLDAVRSYAADFWDGDSTAGAAARARLAHASGGSEQWIMDGPGFSACADGLHGVRIGDDALVRRGAQRLLALLTPTDVHTTLGDDRRLCAAVLEAALAARAKNAAARELLVRADSLQLYGVAVEWSYYAVVAAHLYDAIGDPQEALRMLRRRAVAMDGPGEVAMLSTTLREEGRLAEAVGDRDGAVHAYRRYLALRSTPDPVLVPQRDSVRAALDALLQEPRPDLKPTR